MKNYFVTITVACALTICAVVIRQKSPAQDTHSLDKTSVTIADTGGANANTPPIPVTEIPPGYRDWRFISVAHEEGNLHSFAAVLGNDAAIKAYREEKLPYPDGTIIAALHYHHVPSEEN